VSAKRGSSGGIRLAGIALEKRMHRNFFQRGRA
jgi:hypothetical protein